MLRNHEKPPTIDQNFSFLPPPPSASVFRPPDLSAAAPRIPSSDSGGTKQYRLCSAAYAYIGLIDVSLQVLPRLIHLLMFDGVQRHWRYIVVDCVYLRVYNIYIYILDYSINSIFTVIFIIMQSCQSILSFFGGSLGPFPTMFFSSANFSCPKTFRPASSICFW